MQFVRVRPLPTKSVTTSLNHPRAIVLEQLYVVREGAGELGDAASGTAGDALGTWRLTRRPTSVSGTTAVEVVTPAGTHLAFGLAGPAYQAPNAAVALAASEAALGRRLDPGVVARVFGDLRIPGRFEVLATDPPLVVDAAHDPQAAAVLAGAVRDVWPRSSPVVLLSSL